MPKPDWSKLLPEQRGLAVEGTHDQIIIEAFLEAGEKQGLWHNWRQRIRIESPTGGGGLNNVLNSVRDHPVVYGIIDRDWRSEDEIQTLKSENKAYARLHILPRVMIENYVISPIELERMLPTSLRQTQIEDIISQIQTQFDDWLQHGALCQVLHDQGADYFCRDYIDSPGYPKALQRQIPPIDEITIKNLMINWHRQLNPDDFMQAYQANMQQFHAEKSYERCIHGKRFFSEVVCRLLNRLDTQQDEEKWLLDLTANLSECPPDIIPILQSILT